MILISIYPEYVKKIKEGIKHYEFRKGLHKKRKNDIIKQQYVAVYESSPIGSISLILKIGSIYEDSISNLWTRFGGKSGVTRDYFLGYYQGKTTGVAIEIKGFITIDKPINLIEIRKEYPHFMPPQNFYQFSEKNYPFLYKKLKKEILRKKF